MVDRTQIVAAREVRVVARTDQYFATGVGCRVEDKIAAVTVALVANSRRQVPTISVGNHCRVAQININILRRTEASAEYGAVAAEAVEYSGIIKRWCRNRGRVDLRMSGACFRRDTVGTGSDTTQGAAVIVPIRRRLVRITAADKSRIFKALEVAHIHRRRVGVVDIRIAITQVCIYSHIYRAITQHRGRQVLDRKCLRAGNHIIGCILSRKRAHDRASGVAAGQAATVIVVCDRYTRTVVSSRCPAGGVGIARIEDAERCIGRAEGDLRQFGIRHCYGKGTIVRIPGAICYRVGHR
ncbi:MAG: hypothetical protein EPGJADBJ_02701 [Saprospiraceae bacterium]|nr:hypothetical protein [Saprospiraceae bacterium]